MSCHNKQWKNHHETYPIPTVFFAWNVYGNVFKNTSFVFIECQDQWASSKKHFKNMQVRRSPPRSLETLWLGQEWSSTARALPAPHGGIFLWKLRLQRAIASHYHGVNYDKWPFFDVPSFHVHWSFLPASSQWPFDHLNGGHVFTPEKVTNNTPKRVTGKNLVHYFYYHNLRRVQSETFQLSKNGLLFPLFFPIGILTLTSIWQRSVMPAPKGPNFIDS